MATLEKAIEIAARAHAGAVDKDGQPYLLHPLRVMMSVSTPQAQIVAALHDVVEDTAVTFDDLRNEGFQDEILVPLKLVTRLPGQRYSSYVIDCKTNSIALQVKLADLQDNASLSRVLLRHDRADQDSARVLRYLLSYRFLTDQLSETQYLEMMAPYDHPTG